MFLAYNLLLTLLAPIWVPWTYLRARRRTAPVDWKERTGKWPQLDPPGERLRIWVHAVSVGEVIASVPILRRLRSHPLNPEIILSVTTSSGHETAGKAAEGLFDHLRYFPIDVFRFTMTTAQATRAHAFGIMETELWMNAIEAAKVFDATTLLLNGRVSERNHARSRWVKPFYRALFRRMDRCLMQGEADAARIQDLGASNVEVFGNVKFDEAREAPSRGREFWCAELGFDAAKPIVVVGSTRGETEERLVIAALVNLDNIQIVFAPRHLERSDAFAEGIESAFRAVARRSRGERGAHILLDTYGELADVYGAADVAIVGGGFDRLGGQNILQPLARGVPTIHGPHMGNFRDVAALAAEAGATRVAAEAEELTALVRELLDSPETRTEMGRAAEALFDRNAGAADRYAEAIVSAAIEGKAQTERTAARFRKRTAA